MDDGLLLFALGESAGLGGDVATAMKGLAPFVEREFEDGEHKARPVVMYFDSDHQGERQRTVVTEHRGALAGRRVVRGREAECATHYAAAPSRAA